MEKKSTSCFAGIATNTSVSGLAFLSLPDLTAKLIKSQETAQQKKHEAILQDLKLIHTQASEALARLGQCRFERETPKLLARLGQC